MYRSFGKRFFDIVAVLIGGTLLLPFLLMLIVWIKFNENGKVFYIQKRVGKDFKEFNLYKFRTMIENADKIGPSVTSSDDERITKIGRFLRKTKLDELPQLLNVLKGDMSLVGPRPEVMRYAMLKKNEYKKILSIRPGITDNAAIEYRHEEEIMSKFEDKERAYLNGILPSKIKLYNAYVDDISFLKDVRLILQTLKVL